MSMTVPAGVPMVPARIPHPEKQARDDLED